MCTINKEVETTLKILFIKILNKHKYNLKSHIQGIQNTLCTVCVCQSERESERELV